MPKTATRAYLIFTGSGPILVLSTYPKLTDERLTDRAMGQTDRGQPLIRIVGG